MECRLLHVHKEIQIHSLFNPSTLGIGKLDDEREFNRALCTIRTQAKAKLVHRSIYNPPLKVLIIGRWHIIRNP